MSIGKLALYSIMVCSLAIPAMSKLSGKVVDETGKPVANAALSLSYKPNEIKSNDSGLFDFGDFVSVKSYKGTSEKNNPVISAAGVVFTVANTNTLAKVEVFSLTGKKVTTLLHKTLAPAKYTVPFTGLTSSATYVVRVSIGQMSYTSEIIITGKHLLSASAKRKTLHSSDMKVAAEIVAIDTIYGALDGYENAKQPIASYDEEVIVVMVSRDTLPPVIKILGGDTVFVKVGDDAGRLKYWNANNLMIKVTDNKSDSAHIIIPVPTNTSIDPAISGFHEITYSAYDEEGNRGQAIRLLILVDSSKTDIEPPIITLTPDTVRLIKGEIFFDTGISVADEGDSHIEFSKWVKHSGSLLAKPAGSDGYFTSEAGTFKVTYEVMDTHQNKAVKERVIIITEQ